MKRIVIRLLIALAILAGLSLAALFFQEPYPKNEVAVFGEDFVELVAQGQTDDAWKLLSPGLAETTGKETFAKDVDVISEWATGKTVEQELIKGPYGLIIADKGIIPFEASGLHREFQIRYRIFEVQEYGREVEATLKVTVSYHVDHPDQLAVSSFSFR